MSESPDGKKQTAAQLKRRDRESKAMLFQGCSVSELGIIFGMDNRTIAKKIMGCEPCAVRVGHPIYHLKDAAPYLVKPVGDIGEYIRKMHHDDLPPLLNRNYWAGQRERMKFEEEQGDLWRTDDVLDLFATTFTTLRTGLLLLSDAVERETQFSDRQRDLLKTMIDGTLEDLRGSITDKFPDAFSERDAEPDGETSDDDDESFFATPDDEDDAL